jgi:hypothetical protein
MKLNLDDLAVSSFETGSEETISQPYEPIRLTTINDPTAATRCFYCPPKTFDFACNVQAY